MVNKWFKWLVIIFASLNSAPVVAEEIQVFSANLPPFSMDKGYKKPGFLREVVEEMMKRADLKVQLNFLPWKRSQFKAQKQKGALIFGITRTLKRESRYAWLVKLLNTEKVFVSTQYTINSIESAKALNRVTVRFATPYENQLKAAGLRNYLIAHSEEQNLINLQSGVAEAWLTLRHRAEYMWKSKGYDTKKLKIGKSLSASPLYLAGNLSLKNNAELKNKLQKAYDSLVSDGTFTTLHMKYFGREADKG